MGCWTLFGCFKLDLQIPNCLFYCILLARSKDTVIRFIGLKITPKDFKLCQWLFHDGPLLQGDWFQDCTPLMECTTTLAPFDSFYVKVLLKFHPKYILLEQMKMFLSGITGKVTMVAEVLGEA